LGPSAQLWEKATREEQGVLEWWKCRPSFGKEEEEEDRHS